MDSRVKPKYTLRLFITGAAPNSSRAVTNIRSICEEHVPGKYSLEIIDLYSHREMAEQEQIVAVPLLLKTSPLPVQRLVGDMSDNQKVLHALGIIE